MGRRNRGKGGKDAAVAEERPPPPEYAAPNDPPRAVMAVHPSGQALALGVGPELRVWDAK